MSIHDGRVRLSLPRPVAPNRTGVVLVAITFALFGISRTTGAGWVVVVMSGSAGLFLVGAIWPAVSLALVSVDLDTPTDAVAFRDLGARIRLRGPRQHLRVQILRPGGPPAGAAVPGEGVVPGAAGPRGLVEELQVELRSAAPLGLQWWVRRGTVRPARPIEVAPEPLAEEWAAVTPGASGGTRPARGGAGGDAFRSVREYRPGDPARLVHWKASARRGELVVRELESPEVEHLVIVVDLSGPPDGAEVHAAQAAGLAEAALRHGVAVTMATNERGGPRTGWVAAPVEAGRRLARAVPGAPDPGPLGRHATVVHVGPGSPDEPVRPASAPQVAAGRGSGSR